MGELSLIKEQIKPEAVPCHIAVIMDGNGRWARKKGAARVFGHRNAIKAVRDVTEGCVELGVNFLTLYAFSTENWSRPKFEVTALMELLVSNLVTEFKTLMDNQIRLTTIGDTATLPPKCQKELKDTMEKTSQNTGMTLVLALSYSGRWDITRATKAIAKATLAEKIKVEEINQGLVEKYLDTSGIPDPELLIRTSGEQRISNFLLWQIAYTEFFITDTLWPDFRKEHLYEAIVSYQKRERRFGRTSEQIKS